MQINIPFLDAIQQVPAYGKFLKDLVTMKRKTNVPKKAFLTKQVSSIIQNKYPVKCKDPGSPTISCKIGGSSHWASFVRFGGKCEPNAIFSLFIARFGGVKTYNHDTSISW